MTRSSMARVSSASTEEEYCGVPAMVAFKWEAAPGKPLLKPGAVSKPVFLLDHLPLPPRRRALDDSYVHSYSGPLSASRPDATKKWSSSGANGPKLASGHKLRNRHGRSSSVGLEVELDVSRNAEHPLGLAPGRRMKDCQHSGPRPVSSANPASEISSDRSSNDKQSDELLETTQSNTIHTDIYEEVEEPPLPLPPGKRPKDGFYLQYPRPIVKPNPASEVLKSNGILARKRLKKLFGLQKEPSFVGRKRLSFDGSLTTREDAKDGKSNVERVPPARIFDLPQSEDNFGISGHGLGARITKKLLNLQKKPSLLTKCLPLKGTSKMMRTRRETHLSKPEEEGHSAFAISKLSDNEVDRHSRPIARKEKLKSTFAAKWFPSESMHVSHQRGKEIVYSDSDEEKLESGPVTGTNSTPSGPSRTSSPDSRGLRGSKHGPFRCFSSPRRQQQPSCQFMASMLMSLFPPAYEASDEEGSNAVDGASEYFSDEDIKHWTTLISRQSPEIVLKSPEKASQPYSIDREVSPIKLYRKEQPHEVMALSASQVKPEQNNPASSWSSAESLFEHGNSARPAIQLQNKKQTPPKGSVIKELQKDANQGKADDRFTVFGQSLLKRSSDSALSRISSTLSRQDQHYSTSAINHDEETAPRNLDIHARKIVERVKAEQEHETSGLSRRTSSPRNSSFSSSKPASRRQLERAPSLSRSHGRRFPRSASTSVVQCMVDFPSTASSSSTEEYPYTTLATNKIPQTKGKHNFVENRSSSNRILPPSLLRKSSLREDLEETPAPSDSVADSELEDDEPSDNSTSEYESPHEFPEPTTTSLMHTNILAQKPATWIVSEEVFKSSSLLRYKLQQQSNVSPRSSFSVDDLALPSLTNPAKSLQPTISTHATGRLQSRSSSLRRSTSQGRCEPHLVQPSRGRPAAEPKSSVMSMVARWESKAVGVGPGSSTSKSAPLSWTSRRTAT